MIEKIFFVASDVRSVTVAILAFTFLIAVAVSFAIAVKDVKSAFATPVVKAVVTLPLIVVRSPPTPLSVKSICPLAPTFVVITLTTAFRAVLNASVWLAPEPSIAPANAFTTAKICLLAFSTASALPASTPAAKGLKVK